MKLIISPAKKMREDDTLAPKRLPALLPQAQRLADCLRGLSLPALQALLQCNASIARLNFDRYQRMRLSQAHTPALLAYEGIQYQYMAPDVFTDSQFDYVERHLRILSGLYGVLRPFDAVTPYRLEMQAKLRTDFCQTLYDYWGGQLAQAVTEGDGVLVNLASDEYARAVLPHLSPNIRVIRVVFAVRESGRLVEKGVYVKMARGEMVRFLAENGIDRPEDIRAFDCLGYRYQEGLSDANTLWFLSDAPSRKGKAPLRPAPEW